MIHVLLIHSVKGYHLTVKMTPVFRCQLRTQESFFFYIIDIKMGSMCPQNNFLYVLCQFCEQIHKTVSSFRHGLSTVHLRSEYLKRMFTSHLGRNLKLGFHGSLRLQDMVPTCDKNILPP